MIYDQLQFTGIANRKSAKHIVVCDTQSDEIDIVQFHNYCINNKKLHGIPYHYVIKRNGDVHNTKPVTFVFELYSALNDDIVIAVEGNTNTIDITASQKASLISLAVELLEKECLSYNTFVTLADLVGGGNPGVKTGWTDIKNTVLNNWAIKDNTRIPVTNISIDAITGASKDNIGFYTISKTDDIYRLASMLGATPNVLGVPSGLAKVTVDTQLSSFLPNTPIIYKNNVFAQISMIVTSQIAQLTGILNVINGKIDTAKNLYQYQVTKEKFTATQTASNDKQEQITGTIKNTIPAWANEEIKEPGYERAKLKFTDVFTGKEIKIPFVVSPSSFSDVRQAMQQMSKTTAGWFIMRMGQQAINLSITGYMLDTEKVQERQSFIIAYNSYVKDTRDSSFQYENKYSCTLTIEGRSYTGLVQSISLTKSAIQQFLYQYNINFLALAETSAYNNVDQLIPENITDVAADSESSIVFYGPRIITNNTLTLPDGVVSVLQNLA